MATEAQKLITMSLNKIAVSRQQRGGINLHKSLLVSHVLMQAKNVYIMENYQAVMQARSAAMDNNNTEQTDIKSEWNNSDSSSVTSDADCVHESHNVGHPVQSDDTDSEDDNKENTDCMEVSRVRENDAPINKESNGEEKLEKSEQSSKDTDSGSQCKQCSKRRLEDITNQCNTQNQSDYDSDSDTECSGAKRIKLESNTNTTASSCTVDAPVNSRPDCKQISSLVNRFSVGFSGLLDTDRHRQTCDEAKNRDSAYIEENSCHVVQGPVESPISCSSQIAGFSPVTPQAIVLSV